MNINPNYIVNQLMNNPRYKNNPVIQNALQLYMNGDSKGLQEVCKNVCREKGVNYDDIKRQFINN